MLLLPVLVSSESDQSQWLCPAPNSFIVAQFTSGHTQFSKVAATKAENSLLSQAQPLLRFHQLLRSPSQVSGETVSDKRAPVSSPEGRCKFYLPRSLSLTVMGDSSLNTGHYLQNIYELAQNGQVTRSPKRTGFNPRYAVTGNLSKYRW